MDLLVIVEIVTLLWTKLHRSKSRTIVFKEIAEQAFLDIASDSAVNGPFCLAETMGSDIGLIDFYSNVFLDIYISHCASIRQNLLIFMLHEFRT